MFFYILEDLKTRIAKLLEILSTAFSVIGLALDIIGAIIMGKGLLIKDKDIEKISGTYADENRFLIKKLLEDREDARFGLYLLAVGFAIQVFGELLTLF